MEKISVLIPTYNADTYLDRLMGGLNNQRLDPNLSMEIIVVDSSSKDRTVERLKTDYPTVKVKTILNHQFDHGGTRNKLASLAEGDYFLFMTQDAFPYDEFLIKELVEQFQDPNVMVAYARQIPKEDASPLETFARGFNYPDQTIIKEKSKLKQLGIKTFFNSNVCSMYRRSFFEQVNGFPEKMILNEDMLYASKVILGGYKVVYCAKAKVYHSHNYSLKQQFKRYFDIGMAFNESSHLLKYASNEKEGLKMILRQNKYLVLRKKLHLIPYAFAEAFVKLTAYQLGKRHTLFSKDLKRKLSAYMK